LLRYWNALLIQGMRTKILACDPTDFAIHYRNASKEFFISQGAVILMV